MFKRLNETGSPWLISMNPGWRPLSDVINKQGGATPKRSSSFAIISESVARFPNRNWLVTNRPWPKSWAGTKNICDRSAGSLQ